MTDRLTPGMLRDLANIVQVWRNRGGHFESFHRALDEEAARRDAEAKPKLTHEQRLVAMPESPGSADAPFMGVPHTGGVIHKPAPAADDLPKQCDGKEQEAFEAWAKLQGMDMHEHPLHYLFLDKRTGGARDGWSAALRYCRPFFEAQAREIAAVEDSRRIAQDTLEMLKARAEKAEACVARLTEALREARIMVASWGAYANDYFKDKHDLAGGLAEIDAALAEANDAG